MSKNKTMISLDQTIGIREFMKTYLNVEYQGDLKLTHYEMNRYLMEKGYPLPIKVSLSKVNSKKINNGTYVLVREESKKKKKGKIISYQNPLTLSFGSLMRELQEQKNYAKLRHIRKMILEESNLEEDSFGNIVEKDPEEEILEINVRVNRQKTYVQTSTKHYKKKGRY